MKKLFGMLLLSIGMLSTAVGQEKVLQVYFNDRPPLYIVNGETGFLAEIAKLILTKANVPFKFVDVPSNRILVTIQEGREYGVGLGWFKNPEREKWALYSKPIYQDQKQVVIVNKDKAKTIQQNPTLAAILRSGLMLGFKDGYSFGTAIDEAIKKAGPKISTSTSDVPIIFKMIDSGRMDYTIFGREEATFILKTNPELTNLVIVPISDAPEGNLRYFMFSKAVGQDVVDRVNRAIDMVLASPEYKALTTF